MARLESNQFLPGSLFHLVGYGLLAMVFLNTLDIFIPPHFMDSTWELQTVGALVESTPISLLGLMLVFYGESNFRRPAEKFLLKILSWVSLLVGALFLLLIPLGASSTVRINNYNNVQINNQYSQQVEQIEQIKRQVDKTEARDIAAFIKSQSSLSELPNFQGLEPPQLKDQFLSQLAKAKQNLQIQSRAQQTDQRDKLLKRSFKWTLGALISGFLFIYVWRLTGWAR